MLSIMCPEVHLIKLFLIPLTYNTLCSKTTFDKNVIRKLHKHLLGFYYLSRFIVRAKSVSDRHCNPLDY